MVFEGILVEVLNRFLGPYVKNLDASQLRVGIWGGDVQLKKLELKENALDDLDLPIRIFGGSLDRLTLKIPWKNLYNDPVIIEVDGVYVLAGPAAAAKYNPEKAAKEEKEHKEKQLKQIEEAKKKAAESKENEKEAEKSSGFVEKLITQIVRNVQVTVKNIHIRYEDAVTNPDSPFSCGVTLDSLYLQSTDSDYEVGGTAPTDPTSFLIYKLVQMNCLAMYWNSQAELFGTEPPEGWMDVLEREIARPDGDSPPVDYIVHPISAEAKLQLTTRPGRDVSIPQALVKVVMNEVAVALEKQQYCDILRLVESFDRMTVNQKFRKYKPDERVSEDVRGWWQYAITAVLEEDVKRRTQMWSWKHIKEHRELCRAYQEAYTKKLLVKKSVPKDLQAELERLEAQLDVFNITVCRQLAETQAQRKREEQEAESGGGWWGWTTSWLGSSTEKETEYKPPSEEELAREREKLYEAIGYSANAKVAGYTKEYVAHKLLFDLKRVSVKLKNEEGTVAHVVTRDVSVSVEHRPAASNIGVSVSLGSLGVEGQPRRDGEGETPEIVSTKQQEGSDEGPLLKVEFHLNPIDSEVDQKICAKLQPVRVIYDADTIDAIIGMFLPPKDIHLQKLSATAASTLEELKTQYRAGLEHAISQRKLLDVDISIYSPYVIVPENGVMSSSSTVLVADLGYLHITSDLQHNVPDVREATDEQLQEAFYDHFNLSLSDVQVIVAGAGDDWESVKQTSSPLHILEPAGFELQLKKSLLPNDTRLPSLKVGGELPSLILSLSDKKVKQVLKLLQSLPLPPPSLANRTEEPEYGYELMDEPSTLNTTGIIGTLEGVLSGEFKQSEGESDSDNDDDFVTASEGESEEEGMVKKEKDQTSAARPPTEEEETAETEVASTTKLSLEFAVHEIGIHFSEHILSTGTEKPRLDLKIKSVTTEMKLKSWDLRVTASVGSAVITDYYSKDASGEPDFLLLTEPSADGKFLTVTYSKYDRDAPHYATEFQSTQQAIDARMSLVKLKFRQESLGNLMGIGMSITSVLKTKEASSKAVEDEKEAHKKKEGESSGDETDAGSLQKRHNERNLHLEAKFAGLEVTLCNSLSDLANAHIKGLKAEVDMYEERIEVGASMADIAVTDQEPGTFHPTVICRVEETSSVISASVIIFKKATKGDGYADLDNADLSVEAQIQRLRVTVVFRFLNRIKDFATHLLMQLKLDQKTIDSAKEAAAKTASRTAEALRERSSSRVRLAVTIQAPVVIIPLSAISQSALIADLGTLEVHNKFLLASDAGKQSVPPEAFLSSTGLPAVVDSMSVSISSLQLGRITNLKEHGATIEHEILKPLEFQGQVTRKLSDWCNVIPLVDVRARLEAMEVHFSPDDYHAMMSVLSTLSDGKTEPSVPQSKAAPSPTAAKDKETSAKEEKEIEEEKAEDSPTPNIHVEAEVGSVQLLLHTADEKLALVHVEGVTAEVDLRDTEIHVQASISDIEVRDLSPDTKYPKIVSVAEGAKAIEAKVIVYTSATKGEGCTDMNKCDLSVEASIGQLKIVALFLLINRLLGFAKQLDVSKKAIESAKKSAQENATAAVAAVQELHRSGQRIKLNISILAPVIIVPVSSQSYEVVVVDLGCLQLSSSFHLAEPSGNESTEQQPIYGKYSIELTKLQVYRSVSGETGDQTGGCRRLILQPFTLTLEMKRNLSAAWYHGMPSIAVEADLGTLKMVASGDDIEMMCGVLNGNLKERSETTEPVMEASADEEQEEPIAEAEETVAEATSEKSAESEDLPKQTFTVLQVSAKLESIGIELHKKNKVLSPSNSSSWSRDPEFALAELTLHSFQASAAIEDNGAIDASVTMESCVLDDSRVEKTGKITRLMGKTEEAKGSNSQPMISVTYKKSQWNDMKVTAQVDGVQVLVDLKFILMLLTFVQTSLEPLMTRQPDSNSIMGMETLEMERVPSKKSKLMSETQSKSSVSESSSGGPKIQVRASVTRPCIALLENAEETHSRALVLRTEVDFMFVSSHGQMSMNTAVKDLHIASTRYPSLHTSTSKVLSPTQHPITATLDALQDSQTIITITLPSLTLTLSPTTVRIILHATHALQPEKGGEDEVGMTSPSDLWAACLLDQRKWYLQLPSEGEDEGTSVDPPPPPERQKEETLTLEMAGLKVIVEEEQPSRRTIPVVTLTMGKYGTKALDLSLSNWSGQLSAKATLSVEVSYYNQRHDVWEPIMEPLVEAPKQKNMEVYNAWTLEAKVEKPALEESSGGGKNEELPPQLVVSVSSKSALQLTLTKTSLAIFMNLWRSYTEPQTLKKVEDSKETHQAAFILVNKLGDRYPVTVKPKDSLKVDTAYSSTLHPGASLPLHPLKGSLRGEVGELVPWNSQTRRVFIVQLELPGFKPLDIALGASELLYYPLRPTQPVGKHDPPNIYGLAVDIDRQTAERAPTVTLRSPLQVTNYLEEDIIVHWVSAPDKTPSIEVATVTADSTEAIPLEYAHSGCFLFQPKLPDVKPSQQALSWKGNTKTLDMACYSVTKTRGIHSTTQCKAFFIHAVVTEEQYSKHPPVSLSPRPHHTLLLHYPLILHNLLPSPLSLWDGDEWVEIQSGHNIHFSHATLSATYKFQTRLYLDGRRFSGELGIGPKTAEYSTFKLSTEGEEESKQVLTVHKEEKGTWHISIYSSYWMVNKTEMALQYTGKGSDRAVFHHPPDKNIVLFSYKEAKVRVLHSERTSEWSEWSRSFPLDAIGSEGIFSCRFSDGDEYQMGTKVELSQFGLTKIITISPLYMVYNRTRDVISFQEIGCEQERSQVINLLPKTLIPFWPQCKSDRLIVTVNDRSMTLSSKPFKFTETSSLLMRTNSVVWKGGGKTGAPGLVVDIQVTGSANIISFLPYYNGCVPLQLVNDTDYTIEFKQDSKDTQSTYKLEQGQSLMYTWDDPLGSREISWNLQQEKKTSETCKIGAKDSDGTFPFPKSSTSSTSSTGSQPPPTLSPVSSPSTPSRTGRHILLAGLSLTSLPEESQDDVFGGVTMAREEGRVWEGKVSPKRKDRSESGSTFKKAGKMVGKFAGLAMKKTGSALKSIPGTPKKKRKKGQRGYWVSFMDGLQRVVLFTTSREVRDHALEGNKTERASLELSLSLIGVGVSLVDDWRGLEIGYIGLPQSDAIWEEEKRKRHWKPVSIALKNKLEDIYQQQPDKDVVEVPETEYQFDVQNMVLKEKGGGGKQLRRSHFEGVFVKFSYSKHLASIQAMIGNVQIDNQLPFSLNPTILYAYPPSPTIASKYAPKPFIESSVIIRNTEHSSVNEIQLLQVLIQEMGVKVDMSFIFAVLSLMEGLITSTTEAGLIEEDVKRIALPLEESKLSQVSAVATRNYFKYLHLSPLDIHLSFSLEESGWEKQAKAASERNLLFSTILNVLSSSAMLISKSDDVELKLGYFELENVALTRQQLISRVSKHYTQQAVYQVYSIILGLEMLGNPVGFVKGVAGGTIDLFYQPIQGAVLGPEEFFEGLALGGRQFVGGTIGGLSGVVGKVTGVLGDTVAKLTFDDEFQEKRKRMGSVRQGVEGAAMGVYEGVTGIVTQPVKGAMKEGLWGLVKGTGKGFVGLVLRPTGGLIDLTSATLTAVQKKTQVGDKEVAQIRPARYIGPEKIVYPYSRHRAEGYALFLAVDNGKLADSDSYFDHLELVESPLKVLLIMSNGFHVIKRNIIFDKLDSEWEVEFAEVIGPSTVKKNVIVIPVLTADGGFPGMGVFGLKKKKEDTKTLAVKTEELAQQATSLINQAYEEYRTTQQLATQ